MPTECSAGPFGFGMVEGRPVVAAFDGGAVTSDAGALLLGATDKAIRLSSGSRPASRWPDAERIEHAVTTLVGQRVVGIALGYEDLVDHDRLRHDPVMAILAGKLEARRTACAPLAGKSTLNRLEHGTAGTDRYHKIGHDAAAIERLLVDFFLDAHRSPPKQIVLDLDATDDPLHGHQEGRFFHGYYGCYCYLPLYVFCGRHLLAAKLRRSNIDASAGAIEEVGRIASQIRQHWPRVRILLRADSGFAREALMGVVRGESDRLRLRFRPQRPAGRRHRRRACSGRGDEPPDRRAGPPVQGAALGDPRQLEPPASGDGEGRVHPWRAQPASSSPRSSSPRLDGRRLLTRASTAPAARWRTGSRSASSICSPTELRRRPCAPISSACGSPRWPMSCSRRCGASALPTPSSPPPPAVIKKQATKRNANVLGNHVGLSPPPIIRFVESRLSLPAAAILSMQPLSRRKLSRRLPNYSCAFSVQARLRLKYRLTAGASSI